MRYLFSLACTLALLGRPCAAASTTALFNGHDLTGWEFVTIPAKDIREVCKVLPAGVIATSGQPIGFIATTASYENYRLHAEWRWTGQPGNSGVLVHIGSGPKDRAWPLCLQIQLKHKSGGDLLPMAGAVFAEPLTLDQKTPQLLHFAADSEKPVGEWNTCDIICRGDTIEVTVNGVLQNKVTHATPHAGRIGFQLEGTPYELRNLSVQRLD